MANQEAQINAINAEFSKQENRAFTPADFVEQEMPGKQAFRKAAQVIKSALQKEGVLTEVNGYTLDFSDIEVKVGGSNAARTLEVGLKKQGLRNRYINSEYNADTDTSGLVLNYSFTNDDFARLFTEKLGFALTYAENQVDEFINALPEGLSGEAVIEADEQNEGKVLQKVIVTVDPVADLETLRIGLTDEDATSAIALLQGCSVAVAFVEDAIDIVPFFANRNIEFTLDDLVEAVAA